MLFFTSDTHLGGYDIIGQEFRPVKSPKEFAKKLKKIWNSQAKKGDTIYVIGDFIDCHERENVACLKEFDFVKGVKADVVLILGNNEERIINWFFGGDFAAFEKFCLSKGIKKVLKNTSITVLERDFYLTHKALDKKDGVLNLFGHSHRAMGIFRSFGFNVGCDLNHFRLYSENDIAAFLDMRENYWLKDENLKLI